MQMTFSRYPYPNFVDCDTEFVSLQGRNICKIQKHDTVYIETEIDEKIVRLKLENVLYLVSLNKFFFLNGAGFKMNYSIKFENQHENSVK